MIDICITLVNTNEKDAIYTCLTSLLGDAKNSGLRLGIVIVDNNSTEDIEPLLTQHFPDAVLLRQKENKGFGASHNRALTAVDAQYYFVLNPDTQVEHGSQLLKKMFDFMEKNQQVGMVGPRIVYPDGSLQYSCWRFPSFLQPICSRTSLGKKGKYKKMADMHLMKDFDHNATRPVDAIMGSAMFVRKKAIEKVGGFDERFWMYFEDIDWCKRMWENHWPIYYLHTATLSHVHGRASAKVPGIITALIKNKYARAHLKSWIQYCIKWRGNHKFYGYKKT